MYIERKTQPYTKYINRNLWEQALAQGGSQAEKLEEFFRRFHKGPQELKMAIDNVTLRFFPNLLQCCLESLTFLSKSDLKCQCYYIEQILESSTVESLFFNELDIMNRKTYQTQNEITDYKKFINYFLRFVECSLKLKLRQLPKYINKIEQIVSSLQKRNSNFQQEFETIQKLKDQIDILNNNQPNKNNNVNNNNVNNNNVNNNNVNNNNVNNNNVNNNVNSGPYQQKNSENQYRPRDFQVEFLQDRHNNNTNLPQNSNSLNNHPQIQQQQFVQIQPITNNSQSNLQQPSYGFHNTNNVNTQQKEQDYFQQQSHGTFVQKNSQFDNDNSSGFETLQLNSISQFSQKQYLPQQSNQQISFIPQQSNSYLQTQQKQYPPQQSIQYSQIQQNQVQNNQQNSYQQIPQPQYSTQYNQPQNQMYQQEQWVEKSQVSEYKNGIQRSQQDSQGTQYQQKQQKQYEYEVKEPTQYQQKEELYEVKKSTQYSNNSSNSSQQHSQVQNSYGQYSKQSQVQMEFNETHYNNQHQEYSQQSVRSNNQGYQNKYIKQRNYDQDKVYYQNMKNFYQFKQSANEQRQKPIQMGQAQVSYKNCPREPIFAEFDEVPDKNLVYGGCIFEIPFGQPFQSTELFLNNHFFILREDYLKSFRQVVAKLKQSGFRDIGYQILQSAFLYYNVLIENITVTNKGFQFIVTMNAYDPKNDQINWQKTTRLMSGSLLLLSTTKLEFMLFGTVVEKPQSMKNGRVSIALTLIGLTMKEQLRFVNSMLSQEQQLIAIENKIYFETYTHFLSCIQMIEPSQFPFAEQIVLGSKTMPKPRYLDTPQFRNEGIVYDIDLKFDLHLQKRIGQLQRINILREWPKINNESLDDSQLKAIQMILKNGISLIQGPPGTGKTFCGALGVRILLQNQFKWNQGYRSQNKPILIVCQTNHALDQFLSHILTFCDIEDIVRIGGRCKVKEFEPMLLQFNQNVRKIHFDWGSFLELRQDLDRKLRNLLNLTDNVNHMDVSQNMPDLYERVVFQYLDIEDLNFNNPLSTESRKIIIHMWLDNFKPQDEQARKIIEIEKKYGNYLLKNQANRKKFRPIMVYKYSDLEKQFHLSDEAQQQLDQDNDQDFIDENENLDSDEEENRKVLITQENKGKDEFIKKLIDDQRTMKRLLNRLSKDNEASFDIIMNEINQKDNYQMWDMTQAKRNVITRFIFSQKFQYLFKILENDVELFESYINKLKYAYIDRDLKFIQTKKIVGVTLAGCAKYAEKLSHLQFHILVVEEAGEVLESNLIAVLSQQIQHLILIGDHQQLKPHMECYDLEVKFRANISLFERLIKNGLEYVTLRYQRRMKSKFADFIRLIYSDYQDHSSIQEQNKINIEGINTDLIFFNHRHQEDKKLYSSSKQNKFEARMIVRMVDYLIKNGYKATQITILTTYVRQALYIQKECQRGVRVQPIDNYQGEENDIILLSLVRSNDEYKLGFVAIDNRVCVAFSRARLGLFIFGDFDFIEECIKDHLKKDPQKKSPDVTDLWLKIIKLANQKGVIQNYIELKCSSHNQVTKISEERDWDEVKGGGCQNICNLKFPCGHICQSRCHKSSHNQQDCPEQCEKELACGHVCLGQCRQTHCPPCRTMIDKQIIECGHFTKVQCSEQNKKIQCREKCTKMLKCGHQCTLLCMDNCKNNKCLAQIIYTFPICKHQTSITCDDLNYLDKLVCRENCQNQLICGHDCSGSCGLCFEKFHQPCQYKCDKTLLCGHKCKQLCSSECYKCEDLCQIECNCQIRCSNKCYETCNSCQQDCHLSCQHNKCTKQCYEICDRKPCNQKCDQKLKCGCDCMGFCGEVCPEICQVNEHNTQSADKDTIYYKLECKCNLISEAEFLDQYFDSQQSNLIHCPGCSQIIWRSSRYQKQVKNSLIQFDIEKQQKQMKYEVTPDKINKAIQLVDEKLKFLKKQNLKDTDSFLDNIIQDLKQELHLINQTKPHRMSYHYFKCIKRQLKCYEKSVQLTKCLNDNLFFQIHKHNLIKQYLMSEDFRKSYSNGFWWKVTQKLENLLLYQKSIAQYQLTKDQLYQNISYAIEDSNFFLDDAKKQTFDKILNNPDPAQI